MSLPARARSIGALAATVMAVLVPAMAFAQESAQRSPNRTPPAGASVIVIIPDSLESAPRTVTELLRDYVPSAMVNRSTGAIGASAFVSLRDASAVLGGDPLVVIDGIRQVSSRASLDTLDRRPPSILDDIMVEDIARIEILPGPAAAASYGSDGQMGAILITTRAPGRGHPAFSASVTASSANTDVDYARNLSRISANGLACPYPDEGAGYCTATATTRYTPLLDRSPFRSAQQVRAHFGAIGGLGALGYAASLGFERGHGTLESDAADRTVASLRLQMPISPIVRIGLSSFATGRGITFPAQGDYSLLTHGVGGGPLDCSPATPCGIDSSSGGYGYPVSWLEQRRPHRRIGHLGNALTVDVDPHANLSLRTSVTADMFRDLESARDSSPIAYMRSFDEVTANERSWRVDAAQEARFTADVAGASSTTLLAVRFDADRGRSASRSASFASLPPPYVGETSSIRTADASLFGDRFSQSLDERLTWGERAALGIGLLRTTTDFGEGAHPPAILDPHADAMYQLVAPTSPLGALQSLRLRTAWGRTSSQSFWAVNNPDLFTPGGPTSNGGYGYASPSRPRVPADRSTELEGGLDAAFAPASSQLSITAFRRAEQLDYLAPLGLALPSDRKVTGGELIIEATPIKLPLARLHLRGQLAVSHDRLDEDPVEPIFLAMGPGVALVANPGQSWGAWRMLPAKWDDANGDGRIDYNEISFLDVTTQGRSRPSNVALLAGDLQLFNSVTLRAVVDHVGGFDVFDAAAAQQCVRGVCPALNDPNASLAAQGRAVAAGALASGYVVPGDATSLRELSLSWHSPRAATMMHATALRVTLSAYDLARWTRSQGLHPETDGPAPGLRSDLLSIVQPIPRTFALRVALGY